MTYKIDDKYVFYGEKKIFEAPAHICSYLVNNFNDSAMIAYTAVDFIPDDGTHSLAFPPKVENAELQKLINQNVLCIDNEGNLLWQIEPTSEYPDWFFQIVNRRGEIWARRDRWQAQIDPLNGKILKTALDL